MNRIQKCLTMFRSSKASFYADKMNLLAVTSSEWNFLELSSLWLRFSIFGSKVKIAKIQQNDVGVVKTSRGLIIYFRPHNYIPIKELLHAIKRKNKKCFSLLQSRIRDWLLILSYIPFTSEEEYSHDSYQLTRNFVKNYSMVWDWVSFLIWYDFEWRTY